MANTLSTSESLSSQSSEKIGDLIRHPVAVRVSPNSYAIAAFVSVFFSGLFLYLHLVAGAAALGVFGTILMPLALWRDKIVFDGTRLIRTGIIPRIWSRINNVPFAIDLDEVELVESQALRALKRGGIVFYRYRTTVSGRGLRFVIASGGERYRSMIRAFLPMLAENLLDNRSIELRDYTNEPKETLMKAQFAKIPSTDVLEDAIFDFPGLRRSKRKKPVFGDEDLEKAEYLRTLANELRLSGNLLQALEVFRRALFLNPKDGWLLFEFARCLHSFAGAEKNTRIEKRALAVLRLAEKRAEDDDVLLARLGESYFQYGEWSRAMKVFKRTIAGAESSFRAVRGLAEIALREGKIAHVIHHFSAANRLAETPSLRRWAQTEADYFSRLNNDAEYMDLEVNRVNLLGSLEQAKGTALKVGILGLPAIAVGFVIDIQLLINVGWAVSCVALLIWTGIVISRNILSDRIPVES